jgi:hypothetical protein
MDCEKFDQHVIDALYDELDELTHAALRRHVEGCSRCAGIFSGLRATREVGVLPLEEPSDELEARILDAVATAQRKTPWPRKLLRGLAWAGSHAMRPQLAMAALFFLVIGSSLLLLRAKPGTIGAPVRITEYGMPTPEQVEAPSTLTLATPPPLAAAPAVAPAAPAATAAHPSAAEAPSEGSLALAEGRGRDDANKDAKESKAKEKELSRVEKADQADRDAAKLALADARSVRDTSGCASAVSKFDEVGTRFPGTGVAADAMWDAAACHKSMGDVEKARQLYLALKSIGSYRERAEGELAMEANTNFLPNQVAARAATKAAAPPPAAAAPVPVAAKRPAASTAGSPGKATAAPKRAVDASF